MHNDVRDELMALFWERGHQRVPREQVAPFQPAPVDGQDPELDQLDLVAIGMDGRNVYIDVEVTVAHSRGRVAAVQAGAAAAAGERSKKTRYPRLHLVPAVVEAHGRSGAGMATLVRAMHAGCDPEERPGLIGDAWQRLSCTLQRGNAEVLLSALAVH